MIEVRSFEGDAAELVAVTQLAWQSLRGEATVAVWDEAFFDWQLLWERPGGRDLMVGAYDGTKLVGVLPSEHFRFRLGEGERDATLASWLSVDPAYGGQGIARQLTSELRRRHHERELAFMCGFGIPNTRGPGFWTTEPDTFSPGSVWVRARPLDLEAGANFALSSLERGFARLSAPLWSVPVVDESASGIRSYRAESDLDACLELTRRLSESANIACLWNRERLAHQLDYRDVPRTLVLEEGGRVAGFINYYRLRLVGRSEMDAGMVDLLATGGLSNRSAQQLIRAALARMAEEGMGAGLMLRAPGQPGQALAATGWLPTPEHYQWLFCFVEPGLSWPRRPRIQIHLR